MTTTFDPIDLGSIRLRNRIVMAPKTRSRASGAGNGPTPLMAQYYAQRASAGLIITEGIQPSAIRQGCPFTPGLHSAEQTLAWRDVTTAVHRAGGVIFAQLMHTGRIGHPAPPHPLPRDPRMISPRGARGRTPSTSASTRLGRALGEVNAHGKRREITSRAYGRDRGRGRGGSGEPTTLGPGPWHSPP